jgi:uncharacterized protein (DUF849 family)
MFLSGANVSFVMGVASGMPAKPQWLPLLVEELPANAKWQCIAIGQDNVWPLLRRAAELGGNVRTGLEDTFSRLGAYRVVVGAAVGAAVGAVGGGSDG